MYETGAGRRESGYRSGNRRHEADVRRYTEDSSSVEDEERVGPPQAETMMRDAYACGADDAVIHSVLLYIARIPSAFLSPYPRCMYILRTRVRNSCKDSRKPYREAPVGLP